jgi:alanine dehydrogenase
VVCCCTDSQAPIFRSESIQPGTHVSSVGRGAELPAGLVTAQAEVRVFVEWPGAVTSAPPAGAVELQHLSSQGSMSGEVTLIGDVLLERKDGRTGPGEITVFKSTGHAAQDLAVAVVAMENVDDAVPAIEI